MDSLLSALWQPAPPPGDATPTWRDVGRKVTDVLLMLSRRRLSSRLSSWPAVITKWRALSRVCVMLSVDEDPLEGHGDVIRSPASCPLTVVGVVGYRPFGVRAHTASTTSVDIALVTSGTHTQRPRVSGQHHRQPQQQQQQPPAWSCNDRRQDKLMHNVRTLETSVWPEL